MEQSLTSKFKTIFKKNKRLMAVYAALKSEIETDEFFLRDLEKFRELNDGRFRLDDKDLMPLLSDKTDNTDFDRHYVFHLAWAARQVAKTRPEKHIDISSSVYFAGMISAFINVEFFDYRPARLDLTGLKTDFGDLTNLKFDSDSIDSLSCMHVIEHIGLGRYGDPINPKGDLVAANELSRVLSKKGKLLVVLPVGKPRIEFNAHRIYSLELVKKLFSKLNLVEYSLIPDNREDGDLILNPSSKMVNSQNWGCGCFVFTKE